VTRRLVGRHRGEPLATSTLSLALVDAKIL
jgi:hypothetical protein